MCMIYRIFAFLNMLFSMQLPALETNQVAWWIRSNLFRYNPFIWSEEVIEGANGNEANFRTNSRKRFMKSGQSYFEPHYCRFSKNKAVLCITEFGASVITSAFGNGNENL